MKNRQPKYYINTNDVIEKIRSMYNPKGVQWGNLTKQQWLAEFYYSPYKHIDYHEFIRTIYGFRCNKMSADADKVSRHLHKWARQNKYQLAEQLVFSLQNN